MAETIDELYLKLTESVGNAIEDDRYFRYLYEMIQAGENSIEQSNQVLKKIVDERWLQVIEDSLDAINNIIDKPRRFIKSVEEVVPVELAKKITADSVRHLSMNTQFITRTHDGEIHPTRILNTTSEDSYDLYENRFIYYLIQRLVAFVDRRTDVIFWSTGDEKRSRMKLQSKIEDGYEEIDYKLEITIKNRQSFAENDTDNMDIFMRIDRVRRMVLALKNSAFCSIMQGCSKVRSPIQRTNLLMKDPYYRKCYQLWQFLEGYDDVGYTIDVVDYDVPFDEEYIIQTYTNLISNYAVFKSLLESDERNLDQVLQEEKPKHLVPKILRKVEEVEVDDYNLEDVEIKKVFVEEVTEAQIKAEEALAEETQRRIRAEEDYQSAIQQLQDVFIKLNDTIERNSTLETELNRLLQAQDEAQAEIKRLEEQNKALQIQKEESERDALVKITAAEAEAERRIADAESRIEKTRAEADSMLKASKTEFDDYKLKTEETIRAIRTETAETIEAAKTAAAGEIHEAETKLAAGLAAGEHAAQEQIRAMREQLETEYAAKDLARQEQLRIFRNKAEAKEQERQRQLKHIREKAEAEITAKEKEKHEKIKQIREEADARISEAQAAAEKRVAAAMENAQRRVEDGLLSDDMPIVQTLYSWSKNMRKSKKK